MTSEAAVQVAVRLEYARRGYQLFRNNSGVMKRTTPVKITQAMVGKTLDVALPDNAPIRFGLANDSPQVNARLKSSDLIGWDRVIITADMIGRPIARFTSFECKPPGWTLRPGDARGQAQQRWIDLVNEAGGEARFVTGVDYPPR